MEALKKAIGEEAPTIDPNVDPYDARLMAEILKYNQKANQPAPFKDAVCKPNKPSAAWQKPNVDYDEYKKLADIDMQKMDDLFKVAHNMPKIELHAHIGGCYRPQTFVDLAEEKKINIDHIDFYNVDIKTAFEIFKVGSQLITTADTLKRVTKEIIEDYARQNTRYLELRSTPKKIGDISSKEEYLDSVIDAIKEMKEERSSLRVCFLVSVNRAQPVETAAEAVDLLIKYKEKAVAANEEPIIVGLELSGDPRVGSFSTFRPEFERAQSLGFKVSLHCAETKEQTDSQEMIDFKPDRLGHCCYLSKE